MYAVGHLALAYLTGKAATNTFKVRMEIPLVLALSVLPDIDFLLTGVQHRGPTHSIIILALPLIALAIYKRKTSIPYIAAILQHLASDILNASGIQLLWPLSAKFYGVAITASVDISAEWALFLASTIVLAKTGDLKALITGSGWENLALLIPINSIFSPLFLHIPIIITTLLYIPHIILLSILILPFLNTILKKTHSLKSGNSPSAIPKNPKTQQ
ncbi:MAG: hypothetical protein QG670_592 [Thermoproteota archaeon]|nr:hypothetical protein [Thermoproteota archaeon]